MTQAVAVAMPSASAGPRRYPTDASLMENGIPLKRSVSVVDLIAVWSVPMLVRQWLLKHSLIGDAVGALTDDNVRNTGVGLGIDDRNRAVEGVCDEDQGAVGANGDAMRPRPGADGGDIDVRCLTETVSPGSLSVP